jgi:hypothetical protein
MDKFNETQSNIKNNFMNGFNGMKNNIQNFAVNAKNNIQNSTNSIKDFAENAKENLDNIKPSGDEKFLPSSGEFLSSNTLIAKGAFLLLVIIIFSLLFYIFSKIIIYFLSPSSSPYLIYGMKDATQQKIINQNLLMDKAVPILRSKDEYEGIEFTYSVWIYINDIEYSNNDNEIRHIFHKGSINNTDVEGIFQPNNSPGLYLYTGYTNGLTERTNNHTVGLLTRINVYHNNDSEENRLRYYDDILVDGIPIKKWVNIIVRLTSQNIADVYINGTLTKRHKLTNLVKQNYDNVYVNMNGGFLGNLSNLKYYNHAINTLEIDNIVSNGPNLKIEGGNNLETAVPGYLSNSWYFNMNETVS